jgi:hypothetical protein
MYNWRGYIPLSSFDPKLRPPLHVIQQHSIPIKLNPLSFQQLTLLVNIYPARRVLPLALKTAYVARR